MKMDVLGVYLINDFVWGMWVLLLSYVKLLMGCSVFENERNWFNKVWCDCWICKWFKLNDYLF